MDKIHLKANLIKAHEQTIQGLKEDYANLQTEGNLNLEDVRDLDDNSHREQAEEYLYALERQISQRETELRQLRNLDFGKKDAVTEGAVALVNGNYYIIGIPACQFDLDGKHYIAMSPDAPFYEQLMGRRQNDSFLFQEKQFTVENIF
ncbi:hypothetical protein [Arachidicoccus terrestris]|uniref:hypothetical protein n=1 Tax=Arachidicoccus terrestris TaxID=2875539 RepID=UPI001CC5A5C6|nr:hypothetical protein [Arachidicoccus terrestris]UAY56011.1 hypothetical protein K9M52_02985 [Arachidicoccus terrestris]